MPHRFKDNKCGLFALNFCFHLLTSEQHWDTVLAYPVEDERGVSIMGLAEIAETHGFSATGIHTSAKELASRAGPTSPIIFQNEDGDHYYVCLGHHGGVVRVVDPIVPSSFDLNLNELNDIYSGRAILTTTASNSGVEPDNHDPPTPVTLIALIIIGTMLVVVVPVWGIRTHRKAAQ